MDLPLPGGDGPAGGRRRGGRPGLTFSNTLQPLEAASAAGIAVLLAALLAAVVRNAPRIAEQLGTLAVRAAVAMLLLAAVALTGFVTYRLGSSAGGARVTVQVTDEAFVYRRGSGGVVRVPWGEVGGLSRYHTADGDNWTLRAGEQLLTWDDSVDRPVRLQNLVLERASLLRRDRQEGTAGSWEAHWSRS